jgi:alcohol dehydrogenase YqhD (iron-dependent ADH family)
MSSLVVITNENGWLNAASQRLRFLPILAAQPGTDLTLPAYQTASGATDILLHTRSVISARPTPELTDSISDC